MVMHCSSALHAACMFEAACGVVYIIVCSVHSMLYQAFWKHSTLHLLMEWADNALLDSATINTALSLHNCRILVCLELIMSTAYMTS